MKNALFIKGPLDCLTLPARMFFLGCLILMPTASGYAKIYEEPRSFSLQDNSQEQVEREFMPKLDAERLLAEERVRGKNQQRPAPHRFAVAADVAFTLDNSGTWQLLTDGRLWRLRIRTPGAKNINLGMTRFDMPEGAKLWLYDPAHTQIEGPYTAHHRSHRDSLWTPVIAGDEIVVEIFVPAGIAQPLVEIGKVNRGYRGLNQTGENSGLVGTKGSCNNNVICPAGDPWRNQIRAVGVYTIDGLRVCTGTLLNNTAHDHKAFFLSAYHCAVDSSNDDSVVVYWNFQSASCASRGTGSLTDSQLGGATLRAGYAPSDFLLLELSAQPDPSFKAYFAGWDASGATPSRTVGIHHPQGDTKAISFSNDAATTANPTTYLLSYTPSPTGSHWRVLWNSGVTEYGSSGSCLFDASNKRCIGQLHGGPSACGTASSYPHDFYGRLSVSWNGGGTVHTRLKDWLDPGNTGTLSMDGE